MRRFYQAARAEAADDGYSVLLDARTLCTPARRKLALPCSALAVAIAAEWAEQGETIRPATMPLMRLASTAIDRVSPDPAQTIDQITVFGRTDLVCYRAAAPAELAARQEASWEPLLRWAAALDAPLRVTTELQPVAQSPAALAALRTAVVAHDAFALSALHQATAAAGSVVVALAMVAERITVDEAFAASQIDESHQIERWGEDPVLEQRRAEIRASLSAAARMISLLREP